MDLFAPRNRKPIADYIDATGDCWEWTGARSGDGYGRVRHDGRQQQAHRVVYEALMGPIPEGLDIDHLCRNRGCVNPDHLEPVTRGENLRRGISRRPSTTCEKGEHAMEGDNVMMVKRKGKRLMRMCRACRNARQTPYMREYRRRTA